MLPRIAPGTPATAVGMANPPAAATTSGEAALHDMPPSADSTHVSVPPTTPRQSTDALSAEVPAHGPPCIHAQMVICAPCSDRSTQSHSNDNVVQMSCIACQAPAGTSHCNQSHTLGKVSAHSLPWLGCQALMCNNSPHRYSLLVQSHVRVLHTGKGKQHRVTAARRGVPGRAGRSEGRRTTRGAEHREAHQRHGRQRGRHCEGLVGGLMQPGQEEFCRCVPHTSENLN